MAPLLMLVARAALAQSFEAASVKPVEAGNPGVMPMRGGPGTNSPGQLTGAATLKALLMRAFEMKNYQIAGPAWMDSARYEIAAKIPAGSSQRDVSLMLRGLLAERFRLAAQRETRELPIYALVAAKNGPKLHPSSAEDQIDGTAAENGPLPPGSIPKIGRGPDGFPEIPKGSRLPRSYEVVTGGSDGILYKLWAQRETMQQLADRLSSQLNRAVLDRTGVEGRYDFALAWSMEGAGGGVPRTEPPPDEIDFHSTPVLPDAGVSIFKALQEQLGLRLEAKRGPLEMLIVDRVEKAPTAN